MVLATLNPPDPLPEPTSEKNPPVKFRLAAPLSEGVRQRLAGHGRRPRPSWWSRLRAFAMKDSPRWYCWRAGDDEPDLPA